VCFLRPRQPGWWAIPSAPVVDCRARDEHARRIHPPRGLIENGMAATAVGRYLEMHPRFSQGIFMAHGRWRSPGRYFAAVWPSD
jgi:hypothetical protein